ncbi:hypothetical protein RI129_002676 [Pyrocoelia pectoralis]|uniref:U11/U12 small nuclear ribonucleoprotein 35 kDa protein n=1 Tax=Pyrocoelia pectoralis TaxID=417401 RepID=A0AAN7VJM0_9COLE
MVRSCSAYACTNEWKPNGVHRFPRFPMKRPEIVKLWIQASSSSKTTELWTKYAKYYDPIKIGSIDGTDTEAHDKGIVRASHSEYVPNRHVKGIPECTIFVARLSPKTTKDTINEVFSKYGRIRRFRVVRDIVTGNPKGYAFVEYELAQSAEDAYRKANRMIVDGQVIFVDFECERLLKGWKPRRLGGGFGGRKESGQLRFGGRDRPFRKPIDLELRSREHLEKYRRENIDRRDYDRQQKTKHSERRRYSSDRTE